MVKPWRNDIKDRKNPNTFSSESVDGQNRYGKMLIGKEKFLLKIHHASKKKCTGWSGEQFLRESGGYSMEKRKFEKLGVSPSLLGYGCMRFPVREDKTIDEEKAQALLDHAIENGVTYIDTAYPYHDQQSETFVGKALSKYDRDSYYLATKLPVWMVKETSDVRKYFEEQLRRLQTDHVDFYLLHALNKERWEDIKRLDMIHEVEKLREEGKIRHIGFSFHDEYPVFEEILTYRDWDFCQIQLNYVDTVIQQGMKGYELTEKMGIPVVIMEPVKGGALAKLPSVMEDIFHDVSPERSVASWAFRYVATLPNVQGHSLGYDGKKSAGGQPSHLR